MRGKSPIKVVVAATTIALFAAACSKTNEPPAEPSHGGKLVASSGEPESLLPTQSGESEGIAVIQELYTGLINYDATSGNVVYDGVAESMKSDDNKVWKIKLKSGWKFHNGEAVTSDSFINAWNFGAYGPNAQGNSYFFGTIAGYDDLQPGPDPDGKDGPQQAPEPKSKTLSGLKKVDDLNFEVTLTDPFASFPLVVGYSGFFPMAAACLADTKACDDAPIGNGPFKMDGKWNHKVEIKLTRNADYAGTKARLDSLTFKIYDDITTAYSDFQAGEIDIVDAVPPAKYTDAKTTLSANLKENPSSTFTYVGIPVNDPTYKDKRVRQALSLALDRQAIIDAVFNGRFTPAGGLVTPLIAGARDNACKYCKQDVAKAKELLAAAGGWPAGKKLELWFNGGAGHEKWMQVVGDQIKAALGIDYVLKGDLQFAEYLATLDAGTETGPFRLGWGMDYPSMENYLKPIYGSKGSSNNAKYSNPAVDAAITKGDTAASIDAAIKAYQEAEDMILEDMPVIPMWFGKAAWLKGDKVKEITYNRVTTLDFSTVVMN